MSYSGQTHCSYLLLLILPTIQAVAEDTPVQTNLIQPVTQGVAQSRNLLGQTASAIGFGLDSIFGAPDSHQPNESVLMLDTGLSYSDNNLRQISGLSFRADLPATRNKLQLLIRLDDENQIDLDGNNAPEVSDHSELSSQKASPASDSFIEADKAGLFLRYIYQPADSPWQATLDTGWQLDPARFSDKGTVSYLRVGRNYQLGNWQLRPVPSLFWTQASGDGIGFSLHTRTTLDGDNTLQSSSGIHYLADEDNTYFRHGWQLVRHFGPDLRASYHISLYSTENASHFLEEAQISATLRRRISGQWLFFSITPADTLTSENDFRSQFSVRFQLEAKFGTQY